MDPISAPTRPIPRRRGLVAHAMTAAVVLAACSAGSDGGSDGAEPATTSTATSTTTTSDAASPGTRSFRAEVWADNWFSLYVNGELVGEDSVPITTERSFNSETITFDAAYPFTIGMISKDYKENDTGLEYIGTDRQQMGDGGFIVQITDVDDDSVVAVTDTSWRGLVIQRAPLDTSCETSTDPAADCSSKSTAEPEGWADPSFDDSGWVTATAFTEDQVQPKDGYTTISWDPTAQLIWSESLKQDNTILWRHTVEAP